jgi:RsiW-degrading membrane proteinase PrsW (M82 family)
MTQPFLNALWTAVAGIFLVQGFPPGGRKAAPGRAALGLGLAILLHALYESLAPPPTAFLSFLVAAAGLFLLLALKRDAEEEPILTALR